MTHLVSTVPAWLELTTIADADDRAVAWTDTYEAAFPSVFETYYGAWGDPTRRDRAAADAPGLVSQVRAAEARAVELLARAEGDFRALDLLPVEDELHVVLLVGGHSSNGWVVEVDGHPTLFLALEFLGLPPFDDLLVVHELAHVAQWHLSPATRARTYPTSLATVVEGAATATTRVLRPGLTESAYLWMDEEHAAWVDTCRTRARPIATALVEHLDAPDDAEAVAPLLRNRTDGVIPARAAYWVGDQVARELLDEGRDVRDLLALGPGTARERVSAWAARHQHD